MINLLVTKFRIITVLGIATNGEATLHLYFDDLHLGGLVHCPRCCVVHIVFGLGPPPCPSQGGVMQTSRRLAGLWFFLFSVYNLFNPSNLWFI